MPIDAYTLAVFSLPHQFWRWVSVCFARQRNILVLTNRHCALGGQRVQNVRWYLERNREAQKVSWSN